MRVAKVLENMNAANVNWRNDDSYTDSIMMRNNRIMKNMAPPVLASKSSLRLRFNRSIETPLSMSSKSLTIAAPNETRTRPKTHYLNAPQR